MSGIKLRFSLKRKAQVDETEQNLERGSEKIVEEEDKQSAHTYANEASRANKLSGIKLRFSLKKKAQVEETERNVEEDQMVEEEDARS